MTNSLQSYVRRISPVLLLAASLAVLSGCGNSDGEREFALAKQALSVKNLDRAAELFMRAAELNSRNIDALVMLARIRLDLGEITAAEDAVARASALAPDDLDIAELSAQIDWHSKRYKEARDKYEKLAGNVAVDAKVRAQALAALGLIDIALSDIQPQDEWLRDRARTEFLMALALDKKCAPAYYHLGLLYRSEPFPYKEAALTQYEFFKSVGPQADPRYDRVLRVVIPELKEEINRARAERPGATNRDSTAAAESIRKAQLAEKKGQTQAARRLYEAAFKADPLSYEAALGLAKTIKKAEGNSEAGKKRAFDAYNAACHLRSSAVSTFLDAAQLAMDLKKYQSAVELYSRAMAANSRNTTAIDGMIRALRKCDKPKTAAIYQKYRDTIAPARR